MDNPASTIIQYFSPLRELTACILKHKVGVDLSAYGTEVPKPIIVWSTSKLVETLKREPVKTKKRLAVRSEDGGVTGIRKALKSSQAYPPKFGAAVALIFKALANKQSLHDLLEEDGCAMVYRLLAPSKPPMKRKR